MPRKPQASLTPQYQALWLRAFREGEVIVPGLPRAEAIRMRFALYHAGKLARRGAHPSEELCQAVTNVTVSIEQPVAYGPCSLRMVRQDASAAGLALAAAISGMDRELAELEQATAEVEGLVAAIPPASPTLRQVVGLPRPAAGGNPAAVTATLSQPEPPADDPVALAQAALLAKLAEAEQVLAQGTEQPAGNPYYSRGG